MLLLPLALIGCGSAESILTVAINPQEVPGDGVSTSTVTVRAFLNGVPAKDGTSINLSATGGSFKADKIETTAVARTVAGEGNLTWYPPVTLGEYRISASYTDAYKRPQQAQGSVRVIDPVPIDGSTFRFTCAANNIGVPRAGADDVRLPCSVEAKDKNGVAVEFDLNRFGVLAETGDIEVDGKGGIFYVINASSEPVDVAPEGDPVAGEPQWFDANAGKTRNPRDGYAAVVIHTLGTLTGTNDALQGEPFVDANDNGQWDPGETYFDADKNTSWTPAGASIGEGRIWRWVKIVLSGEVSDRSPVDSGLRLWSTTSGQMSVDVAFGGTADFSVRLVDANLNPVASHSSGGTQDTVALLTDNNAGVITPKTVLLARDARGPVFNLVTGAIDGRATRAAYTQGIKDYQFTITNNLRASATVSETWALKSVMIKRTPYPGARQITESLPPAGGVRGTLMIP